MHTNLGSLRRNHYTLEDSGVHSALQRLVALHRMDNTADLPTDQYLWDPDAALPAGVDLAVNSPQLRKLVLERIAFGAALEQFVVDVMKRFRVGYARTRMAEVEGVSFATTSIGHCMYDTDPEMDVRDCNDPLSSDDEVCEQQRGRCAKSRNATEDKWLSSDHVYCTLPPSSSATRQRKECKITDAQLWFDSYAAAMWTNCHARAYERLQAAEEGATVEPPSLVDVDHCAAFEYNISSLVDNVPFQNGTRSTSPLVQLILRAINHGTRGWVTTAMRILKENIAIRHICTHAVITSLTGMHPGIFPRHRPNWKARLVIERCAAHAIAINPTQWLADHLDVVKESCRRIYAMSLYTTQAMRDALCDMNHPIVTLTLPPHGLPMRITVAAARRMCCIIHNRRSASALRSLASLNATSVLRRASCAQLDDTLVVDCARNVFFAGYRAQFGPMWLHAMGKGYRQQRLDAVQYDTVHSLNSVTALRDKLSEADLHHVVRSALSTPLAATLTVQQAAAALGIAECASNECGGTEVFRALKSLAKYGARGAAMLLHYAHVAQTANSVMIVDLGNSTRRIQEQALRRRYNIAEDDNISAHLSELAHCCDCGRVCNAKVCPTKVQRAKSVSTLEYGLSAVTIGADGRLYCARRSSAALRAAQQAETFATQRELDGDDIDKYDPLCEKVAATEHDGVLASRLRRDTKTTYNQMRTARSCGSTPLVVTSLLGCAVKINQVWYTLCTTCGTICTTHHRNNIGTNITCLMCEPAVVDPRGFQQGRWTARKKSSALFAPLCMYTMKMFSANDNSDGPQQCRYCGHAQTRKTATFVRVASPLDTDGKNVNLPPALRVTHWCRSHYRNWIPDAMRVMPTINVIMHIVERARPMQQAMDRMERNDEAPTQTKRRGKRKTSALAGSSSKHPKKCIANAHDSEDDEREDESINAMTWLKGAQ